MLFHDICYHANANYNACMAGYRPVDDTTINQFLDWMAANASRGISIKTVTDVMSGGKPVPNVVVSTPATGQTVDPTPVISGTGVAAAGPVTLSFYSGAYSIGTPVRTVVATPAANGTWSSTQTTALPGGTYTVQSQQTVDGVTGYSSPRTFVVSSTVDTTAPALHIGAPADGSSVSSATPTITGTGGTAPGDGTTVSVKVFNGATTSGTPRQTLTATVAAGGSWAVTPATLPQGAYTVQATQTDTAGNVGTSTAAVTVDTTKPVIRITSPANNAVFTTASSIVAKGSAGTAVGDNTLVTVKVFPGSSTSGVPVNTLTTTAAAGAWSIPVPALAVGTYTLSASMTDAAGNVGTSTNVVVQVHALPKPTSASPSPLARGLLKTLAINGTGFVAGSQVTFSGGSGISILLSSPTATKITLTLIVGGSPGVRNVTVTNPDGGTGTCTGCLTIS
jgi:hypothetical protein